ncbi:MAG TPA: type VI secretion system baseplate subunit TssF [Thiothrix sp.]|nr:type VI secretion system baseplate subunit TssF [Thiothrix sp.]
MEPKLLAYYEKELQFIRDMGGEFAERFPKVAKRLDLGSIECADPYVERLLEGFAFLSARIQLKLDAEFPRFTHHLLDIVYPHYLAPIPSMTIVHFEADLEGGVTEEGFKLPRHTRLRSGATQHSRSRCQFRTAHDVMLWPLKVSQASYMNSGEAAFYAGSRHDVRSGIKLTLEATNGLTLNALPLDTLRFYLQGSGESPARLHELLMANSCSILAQPVTDKAKTPWQVTLPPHSIQPVGFDNNEALLPYTDASFQGYRLLQEYFAFSERFLFIELTHLQQALRHCSYAALEIIILFNKQNKRLQGMVDQQSFSLHSAAAINLFPKRTDRIHIDHRSTEHHLVIDRTRPRDFEVYALNEVSGFDVNLRKGQTFQPFYSSTYSDLTKKGQGYYSQVRKLRLPPDDERVSADYLGSEIFLSLVDEQEAPYAADLKQIGVKALCTNRDLPLLLIKNSQGQVEFSLEDSAPVNRIYSLIAPSDPKNGYQEGEYAWRLINHLSLNYLSLLNQDEKQGAHALRELLTLYSESQGQNSDSQQQVEGVLNIESKAIVRRLPGDGAITFGRGTGIHITCRESAFKGSGVFLLGSVLDRFFARYVSTNSFTQMTLSTIERGQIMQWPVRTGTRPTL